MTAAGTPHHRTAWPAHATGLTGGQPTANRKTVTYAGQPDDPCGFEPDGATTTTWFTPVIRARHRGIEAVPRPDLEPIFTELARQWETAGRLVPGRAEEEWTTLARRYPRPS